MKPKTNKVRLAITSLVLFLLVFSFQNCAELIDNQEHEVASSDPNASLSAYLSQVKRDAIAVFKSRCYECHGGTSTSANTAIPDITNLQQLIDDELVIVGAPQESPLYLSIIDGFEPRSATSDPAEPLTEDELNKIRLWILGAAPEDVVNPTPPSDGGGGGTPVIAAPTFTNVRSMVLAPYCITCHNQRGRPIDTYDRVRAFVTPNSLASPLYTAITSNRMPQGGTPLNNTLKDLVRRWILAGAPNN